MMNIRTLAAAFLALFFTSCYAKWSPVYEDQPVPPKLVVAVEKALPKAPIVEPKELRRILVFSATAGFRHKSIPIGKLALEKMGASTGAYEVVISDDPANFELDALKKFDAVVLLSPSGDFFMPNAKKQRQDFSTEDWNWLKKRNDRLVNNLVQYVYEGGGITGIHAATDCCKKHKDYGDTIGAYFDGHPWMASTEVTIVIEDPEHATIKPVFGDIRDFSFKEEIYQFKEEPYSRERLRILMHLDPERSGPAKKKPKRKDNDYAVAWVQKVGEGRVFYTSIGHNTHIYTNPLMLKHYLAGIQFATGDLEADTTPSAQL